MLIVLVTSWPGRVGSAESRVKNPDPVPSLVPGVYVHHIWGLKQIRRLFGPEVTATLTSVFVLVKLDYCNAISLHHCDVLRTQRPDWSHVSLHKGPCDKHTSRSTLASGTMSQPLQTVYWSVLFIYLPDTHCLTLVTLLSKQPVSTRDCHSCLAAVFDMNDL